jgi:hypothetical protein
MVRAGSDLLPAPNSLNDPHACADPGFMSTGLAQLLAHHSSDFRKGDLELLRGRLTALRVSANQHRPARVWPGHRDISRRRILAVVAGLVADLPILRQASAQPESWRAEWHALKTTWLDTPGICPYGISRQNDELLHGSFPP